MVSETQSLEGITSKVIGRDGYQYPFFDLERPHEKLPLEYVERELGKIQVSYGLPDVFLNSDKEGSYRGYCFGEVKNTNYLRMQLDLIDARILDYNFFWWTVNKGYSTVRANNKHNRPKQQLVSTLHFYSVPIPERFHHALYDTGLDTRGFTAFLGDKGRILWGNN